MGPLNIKLFMGLTFVIILIIIFVTKDVGKAIMYVTLFTNFLIISHYMNMTAKGEPEDQVIVDENLIMKLNAAKKHGGHNTDEHANSLRLTGGGKFSANGNHPAPDLNSAGQRIPGKAYAGNLDPSNIGVGGPMGPINTDDIIDEIVDAGEEILDYGEGSQEPGNGKRTESFTGWYAGYDPQYGRGAGMEAGSTDKDFQNESLVDKYEVMSDSMNDHRPQVPPDNIFDVRRATQEPYGHARMTAYTNHPMNVDEKNAYMAQMRQRDKRAKDGAVLANKTKFEKYWGSEFDDMETSRWWGNRDYEPTITYGTLHYSK